MSKLLPQLDARIPEWNLGDLIPRACPFCGSSECGHDLVRPDRLTVTQCDHCKGWYLPKAPSVRQLDEFYSRYDATHRRTPASLGADYIPRVAEALARLNWISGKRFLDVGFGRGHFLVEMKRRGAMVSGVELDGGMIAHAKRLGIADTWQGTLFDIPADQRFDAILMGDLIEHPLNPRELLERARALLNPGGLLILVTPNAASADGATEPVVFRVDLEHLQYLSPSSTRYLAAELDMAVECLEEYGHPNLFEIGKRPKDAWVTRTIAAVPGFRYANRLRQWLTACLNRPGNYHLFCMLRKKCSP